MCQSMLIFASYSFIYWTDIPRYGIQVQSQKASPKWNESTWSPLKPRLNTISDIEVYIDIPDDPEPLMAWEYMVKEPNRKR